MRVLSTGDPSGQSFPQEVSFGDDHFLLMSPMPIHIEGLHEPSMLTVFQFNQCGSVTLEWIKKTLKRMPSEDGFCLEFLAVILISHTKRYEVGIMEEAQAYLSQIGTKFVTTYQTRTGETSLKPGPYFYAEDVLRPLWRLHEDTNGAFLHTLVHDNNVLRTAGTEPQRMTVAVPPKCHTVNQENQPRKPSIKGWRIAVKDNFQIQSIRMSACSKAYYELYPAQQKNATCIQILIDAGAYIIGTTKLSSFAGTEEPMECIDWQAPWNPRADGYQSPAGSSSGSGVAIAAYSWVDIAIGSDTSGSGRRPGHWNGCFAMRPSHGSLSHEGFLKSFPRFDTPTFFGRNLEDCKIFAMVWYGNGLEVHPSSEKASFSIVYPSDYMKMFGNKEQLALINAFVADLEITVGVSREQISFEDLWASRPPPEANGATLSQYMKDASRDSFFYEDYHNFDSFRRDYYRKFGKTPYISPAIRWQWELSSQIIPSAHTEALKRIEVYKMWFNKVVLQLGRRNTLVVLPIEEISPRYRDDLPKNRFNPQGVPNLFLSPIMKAPELSIPIGECSYRSKVSGRIEQLPVSISVMAAHGQDFLLFDVVLKCLRQSGRPTEVLPGKMLFRT